MSSRMRYVRSNKSSRIAPVLRKLGRQSDVSSGRHVASIENCGLRHFPETVSLNKNLNSCVERRKQHQLDFVRSPWRSNCGVEKPRAPSLFYCRLSHTPTSLPYSPHPPPPPKKGNTSVNVFSFPGCPPHQSRPGPKSSNLPPIGWETEQERNIPHGYWSREYDKRFLKIHGVLLVIIFSFEWRRTSYSRWSYCH